MIGQRIRFDLARRYRGNMQRTFGDDYEPDDILANTRGLVLATDRNIALRILRYIHGERKDIVGPWTMNAVRLMVALHEDITDEHVQDIMLWNDLTVKKFWKNKMYLSGLKEVREALTDLEPWVAAITYTIWRAGC